MRTRFRRSLPLALGAMISAAAAPAWAEPATPDPGQGYYNGFGLDGPARTVVRQWLHDTVVDCTVPSTGRAGRCRLDGITNSLSIAYVGPPSDPQRTAVAFVADAPDSGNVFHGVVGLWQLKDGLYTGGRYAVSDDTPVGSVQDVDGVVSYEAETVRYMPAVEPAIRFRLRLVDDGERLRTLQVGARHVVPNVPEVVQPATPLVPLSPAVETHGADAPVRKLLELGDDTENVFFPPRGQPSRMADFFSRQLIDAWTAAMPAMKAEPVLDGNPVTGTQDTSGLRMESLAMGYHEGRMASFTATVHANVGGDERTFPIAFNVVDEGDAWRIGNIRPGQDGAFLLTTLRDIADGWTRDQARQAKVAAASTAPSNLADAGMSLAEPRYRGEWGISFGHNGSEMVAFPKAGLIAYVRPKASLVPTVRPGDVVYRGSLASPRLSGTAFVFKAGCLPAPYHVEGAWVRPGAIDSGMTLRGRSPVRERNGCRVLGYSATSPNALLRFDSVLDTDG